MTGHIALGVLCLGIYSGIILWYILKAEWGVTPGLPLFSETGGDSS